jgi:hypothetical protein
MDYLDKLKASADVIPLRTVAQGMSAWRFQRWEETIMPTRKIELPQGNPIFYLGRRPSPISNGESERHRMYYRIAWYNKNGCSSLREVIEQKWESLEPTSESIQ